MALAVYAFRVYVVNGWFIVTYGLGIFLLNNFIGFLSPQIDPESDGPLLPTTNDGDFNEAPRGEAKQIAARWRPFAAT